MKRRKFVNAAAVTESGERYIYGLHPVSAWLRAQPGHLRRVYYDAGAGVRTAEIVASATAAGVPVRPERQSVLTDIVGTERHQGVVALCAPFPYADTESVVAAAPKLLVVADQMQDTHNLGALLRTCEAAGAGAVIVPKDHAVPITAAVEVAAAGAAARMPLCRVTNVARTLQTLKECAYWVVGLVAREGADLFQFDPPERVVVVVGGETGIRPLVAKQCDFAVSIPMFGRVESLNASVAAAVALYEIRRRWRVHDEKVM